MKTILRAAVVCVVLAAGVAVNSSTLAAMRGADGALSLASFRATASRMITGMG